MIDFTERNQQRGNKPMRDNIPRLTEKDVLNEAHQKLSKHLELKAEGYVCRTEQLFHILLGVAATKDTLTSVCSSLEDVAEATTIRNYLNQQIQVKDLAKIERAINSALACEIPPWICVCPREIAIDYHDQGYYGKSEQNEGLWVRAEAKNGTTRVYRVATSYVILNGFRFTLAIKFVGPRDENKSVLKFLLKRLKALKIGVKRLYLDKGFASVQVIKLLRKRKIAAIIACPIRGKTGGVRALLVGNKSYLTRHTFTSPEYGKARVEVAIVRAFTTSKRTARKPKEAQWLVYILIDVQVKNVKRVRKMYRRRFGIETSYRLSRKVRGWTTSVNAAYRFLLIGLSFFLLNVWISLRSVWTRKPKCKRQTLDEAHFRLRRFAKFIANALEAIYGRVSYIEALGVKV
jgi:putative transposase